MLARFFQPNEHAKKDENDIEILNDECVDGRLAIEDGSLGDVELQSHRLSNLIACAQYATEASLTTLVGASATYHGDDGLLFKAATHAG